MRLDLVIGEEKKHFKLETGRASARGRFGE